VLFTTGLGRTIEISGLNFILISTELAWAFDNITLLWCFHFNSSSKITTAAAISWAESFGYHPDIDETEAIDFEQEINLVIASKKRLTFGLKWALWN
jgi:hypothetical protein